jgi:hypothetical protein
MLYNILMSTEIEVMRMLSWNLAEEYARHFHLPDKAASETEWQFRERIARSLEEMEERLLAHEVLYNRRMSSDLFACGGLSDGYGDEFIRRIAQQTEVVFQQIQQQRDFSQLWQRLLTTLCFWQKPRMNA